MKHDKRRHEAPEDRRDYQDKLNKREERAEQLMYASKSPRKETTLSGMSDVASAVWGVSKELKEFAEMINNPAPDSGRVVRGAGGTFFYVDEWHNSVEKKIPAYVADTSWAGWKPEPDDLRGKKKKKWHSIQYKAYKQWLAEAEIREAVEAELVGDARTDLGWGGF